MTKHRVISVLVAILGLTSIVMALQRAQVFINGRQTQDMLVSNNKVFVSVAALREAGAVVTQSGNRIEIQFEPLRGRLQGDMIEGRLDEWLSNGTWRVRVSKVEPIENPFGRGPGYAVTVEFRNLTTGTTSLHNTGFDRFQLQDEEGNKLSVAADGDYNRIYNDIVRADGFRARLRFGDPNNQVEQLGQPDKLLILFRPWGGKPALKGFRIFLKEGASSEETSPDNVPSERTPGEEPPPGDVPADEN
jgi:hypothetical protein